MYFQFDLRRQKAFIDRGREWPIKREDKF